MSPPNLCSAHISNDSGRFNGERCELLFYPPDKEIFSILEELEQVQSTSITDSDQISGYFRSDTAFNLSKKVLSDIETKIFEKDQAPIQNKIIKPELRRDFEDFARQMRLNQYFRNEPTSSFSERPSIIIIIIIIIIINECLHRIKTSVLYK